MSLLSFEYYKTLWNPPAIRTGTRMKLWQLTDKESHIEGYVLMPIFTISKQGEILETEVEVYLVPDMSVPILLGEDYQVNYELTVKHSLEHGTHILYSDSSEYSVQAVSVGKPLDFNQM